MTNNTNYIFIYGTLKKGFSNHFLLESNAHYISKAMTDEKYSMYPNSEHTFPFLVKSKKEKYIHGELYRLVSNEALELLDQLENVPSLYEREVINVVVYEDNQEKIIRAYVYFKNEDNYMEYIDYSNCIDYWR